MGCRNVFAFPALCSLLYAVLSSSYVSAESFSFVALGDTAYNPPADYPAYRALIERINSAKPAFTIHVGDTWGILDCSDAEHERIRDFFQEYDHPVIYTPGDNEWIDCLIPDAVPRAQRIVSGTPTDQDIAVLNDARSLDGAYERRVWVDGQQSLTAIRRIFFGTRQSLGQKPIALTRQADVSGFNEMVENALWEYGDVQFGTVHVPGSGNNFFINSREHAIEAIARNRANVEWIKQIFAEARSNDSKAVVIALHASLFEDGPGGDFTGQAVRGGETGPFYWIALAIRDLGADFDRPVLLVNGDFHEFVVDRPFMVSAGESAPPRYANITRLQVHGAPEIKAVRVTVDTKTPWVFGFSPLHN
ncbi:MAG: hypothetical protein O7C67_09420 [Gammaproteobacteria bacterium]|nr:hypothetical protein [Gammaproteobacteria bacterium]